MIEFAGGDQPSLDVCEAVVRFGAVRAVDGVSFDVCPGEMFGIIGPNGAGKTTLLNAISGLQTLESGTIKINDNDVLECRPDEIATLGVGRTFQATEVFNDFSVLDYMMLGRFRHQSKSILAASLRLPVATRQELRDRGEALGFLEEYDLGSVARQRLNELPYGVRKLVDLLRTLFGGNRLLLLDEPTSGTASQDRKLLRDVLTTVRDQGVTTIIVDHDVNFVTELCHRVLVMNFGKELGIGVPDEVLQRPDVLAAYVGLED